MARDLSEEMDEMAKAQQMEEISFGVSDEVTTEQEDLAPVTPEEVVQLNNPVSLPDEPVQVASLLDDAVTGAVGFIKRRTAEAEAHVSVDHRAGRAAV